MKRLIQIPEDVPVINPNTDAPVTKGEQQEERIFFELQKKGSTELKPLPPEEAGEIVMTSFAAFIRIFTGQALRTSADYFGLMELRLKLVAPPKTWVEVDDDDAAFRAIQEIAKDPKLVFPPDGVIACLLTYHPYCKVLLNAPTEKPSEG